MKHLGHIISPTCRTMGPPKMVGKLGLLMKTTLILMRRT